MLPVGGARLQVRVVGVSCVRCDGLRFACALLLRRIPLSVATMAIVLRSSRAFGTQLRTGRQATNGRGESGRISQWFKARCTINHCHWQAYSPSGVSMHLQAGNHSSARREAQ